MKSFTPSRIGIFTSRRSKSESSVDVRWACTARVGTEASSSAMLKRASRIAYSAVVGSMIVLTLATELAGKPPLAACSRTIASLGAI